MSVKSQNHSEAQPYPSLSRRELAREWEEYFINGGQPRRVRPMILESWQRCRNLYQLDPHVMKSVRLSQEEILIRQEKNEILHLARPVFNQLTNTLVDTGHKIVFADHEGWLIEAQGDPKLKEEGKDHLGFNFNERYVGTTGHSLALSERRPVQVQASEHYLARLHPWTAYAAPVFDPVSHEPLAVISIVEYEQVGQAHTFLLISTVARTIEQKLGQMQMVKDHQIMDEYMRLAAGRVSDGLLCLDQHGRIVQMNPAVSKILKIPELTDPLKACPELGQMLMSLSQRHYPLGQSEELIYVSQTDQYLNTVTTPIVRDGQRLGALVLIQDRASYLRRPAPYDSPPLPRRRIHSEPVRTKYTFNHILGGTAAIKKAMKLARLASTNTLPVLITGETGTGKEMIAQAIHNASSRASRPFVVVSCGVIPEELVEAELFGYEAGAFTGARRSGNAGKFEYADGGTIFLDEVGELSSSSQVALLRVLQEMEIVRLGSSLPRTVDVRVIAATNTDLQSEVKAQRFRHDLYYRLNVLSIELPPLRERREDIPILTEAILQEVCMELGWRQFTVESGAMDILSSYHWPGNIRELRNVLQRAAALSENSIIRAEDLQPTLRDVWIRKRISQCGADPAPAQVNVEREQLLKLLKEYNGNISEASRRIGISRRTLHRMIKKHSISKLELLKLSVQNGEM